MKKLLSVLLAVILAVCVLPMTAEQRINPAKEGFGMSIRDFNTVDIKDGNTYTGDILEDADITIINYWATWCGPCVSEMPHFKQMHDYYSSTPEADVQIIGVISEGNGCTPQTAQAFLDQNGYDWLNLRSDSVLEAVFRTSGYIPQTLVIDRDGIVRDHIVGGFPSSQMLREFIEMWLDVVQNHQDDYCNVTFVNGINGETISTTQIPYASDLADLDYPEAPEMEGSTFKSWEASGEVYETGSSQDLHYFAMGDVTMTANYDIQKNKVRFYDGVTGTLLKVQMVPYNQAATAPEHPEHEGFTFTGWDVDFSCITAPIDVHGVCVPVGETTPEPPTNTPEPPTNTPEPPTNTPEPPTDTPEPPTESPEPGTLPGDADGDGQVTIADAALVARMALGLMESVPAADFNGDGSVTISDATLTARKALNLI